VRRDVVEDLLTLLRNPAFAPLLDALHRSLERHGAPKGVLTIETPDQADALHDLVGRLLRPGGTMRVAEIDRILRERTRFRCSLREALELHLGAPIVWKKEGEERALAARERAISRCFQMLPSLGLSMGAQTRMMTWLHAGESALRADFHRWGEATLLDAVRAVARVFDCMPGSASPPIYLAELANEVTGNAHGLDADRPAGALLLRALEFTFPEAARREERRTVAWRTLLLSEAGIARDPVSVRVDTFGLCGDDEYLRVLRKKGVDRPLTLYSLAELGGDVRAWRDVAFVVENPTVFAALVRHVNAHYRADHHPTLICTNGNLNTADHQLLRLLTETGVHLFYSGDFDAGGLEIAAAVLDRYAASASPWRMEPEDYRAAVRAGSAALDPAAVQTSARLFPGLVAEMSVLRQAAHHEGLIDSLKADLDRFVLRGEPPPRRGGDPGTARSVHAAR
jgi:uncharacterized protein (TIGR02679 family)